MPKNKSQVGVIQKLMGIILGFIISSTGCSYPLVHTIEVTRVVRQTVVVTELLVIVETVTPASPVRGNTSAVPATAQPFIRWDTQQVVDAFVTAGLEVSNPRPMTSDDFGLVPMLAIEGTRFFVPSICTDCGGRIMSFSNEEDLAIVHNYYEQMGRYGAVLFSWLFVKDNILVQINGEMPEATAKMYGAALEGIK